MEIDDILKKSFDSPSFVYKEDHWAAASTMIDSYYRARLRNRIIAMSLALLLLLVTGFVAYHIALKNSDRDPNQNQAIFSPIAEANIEDQVNQTLNDQFESQNPAEIDQEIAVGPGSYTKTKKYLDRDESPEKINKPLEEEIKADYFDKKKLSISKNDQYVNDDRGNNVFFDSSMGTEDTEKESELLIKGPEDSIGTARKRQPSLTDNLFETVDPELNQVFNLISNQQNLTSLNTLPLPFSLVYENQEISNDQQALGSAGTDPQKTIRAPWKKMRYFAGAEIMTFPGMRQDANRFVGAGLSAGINWHFQPNFFLDAGLGLSVRSGNFDPSIASTQYTQYFGPRFDSYVFRPKELLNASLPVSIGYEFGKNQLSLGYRINYLIGVYGSMEYASHMNDPNQTGNEYNFEPLNNGWLSKDGFRNFMGGFIISYRYEFSPRIFGGLRFHYLPNDWIAKDFGQMYDINSMRYISPETPVNGLREKNWILGFNMVYIL